MAAPPTTILDLPDDMLHEIFERVIVGEETIVPRPFIRTFLPPRRKPYAQTSYPPRGAHKALRNVCRRWRAVADWVRLSTATICVDAMSLDGAGPVRVRHPTAFKDLELISMAWGYHTSDVGRVAATLINGNPGVRRALSFFELQACCLPSLVPAVTPIASCVALTKLVLVWKAHDGERAVPPNMLAPLSSLPALESLTYGYNPVGQGLHPAAMQAPLPALPDAPRLTRVCVSTAGSFVPVGSDAALGRLRKLELKHKSALLEPADAEDPFLLRAAFDAGTWQPSRLTGMQELGVAVEKMRIEPLPFQPPWTGSRAGSEWAPLADQITSLAVRVETNGFRRLSTAIVAGLGVLTSLRSLRVEISVDSDDREREIVSLDRVRAPDLTQLMFRGVSTPLNLAHFPKLVRVCLASASRQPPLSLRSLVARSSLQVLELVNREPTSVTNLAELFVGGSGWPVLKELGLNMVLEWDASGLATGGRGAPTATEFAQRARQLLPALVDVTIEEPRGSQFDRSRVGFVVACRRHVVPALEGLRGGGK